MPFALLPCYGSFAQCVVIVFFSVAPCVPQYVFTYSSFFTASVATGTAHPTLRMVSTRPLQGDGYSRPLAGSETSFVTLAAAVADGRHFSILTASVLRFRAYDVVYRFGVQNSSALEGPKPGILPFQGLWRHNRCCMDFLDGDLSLFPPLHSHHSSVFIM